MGDQRILRSTLGPKKGVIIGGWRELHNEELHDVHSSPNVIRMSKSRRMRWALYVARMGEKKTYRVLVGKSQGRDH
jgi:hypothetical protein